MSPTAGGTINWETPAYNPDTGLFYVTRTQRLRHVFLTETDPRGSMGLGGVDRITVGSHGSFLTAIEPKTGKVVWREQYPMVSEGGGGGGLLTTAGGLVFGGDAGGNIVAFNATTGEADVAFAHRQRHQPADHLHARRPAAPARRREQHALRLRPLRSAGSDAG